MERFIELGWKILEHKYRYYILHSPIIQDYEYDLMEKEYEALAATLGQPPTAIDMVEVDMNRPCMKQVAYKIRGV